MSSRIRGIIYYAIISILYSRLQLARARSHRHKLNSASRSPHANDTHVTHNPAGTRTHADNRNRNRFYKQNRTSSRQSTIVVGCVSVCSCVRCAMPVAI